MYMYVIRHYCTGTLHWYNTVYALAILNVPVEHCITVSVRYTDTHTKQILHLRSSTCSQEITYKLLRELCVQS